jgi:hypothetical protein
MKKMAIKCEVDWEAYQEMVSPPQDNSLELFARKVKVDRLDIDLTKCSMNRCAMEGCRWRFVEGVNYE